MYAGHIKHLKSLCILPFGKAAFAFCLDFFFACTTKSMLGEAGTVSTVDALVRYDAAFLCPCFSPTHLCNPANQTASHLLHYVFALISVSLAVSLAVVPCDSKFEQICSLCEMYSKTTSKRRESLEVCKLQYNFTVTWIKSCSCGQDCETG